MHRSRSIDASRPALPCTAEPVVRKAGFADVWRPLISLPLVVLPFRSSLRPWVFMWLMASAIFFGCKYLTWRRARIPGSTPRSIAYFFAWPGMEARAFLSRASSRTGPEWSVHHWLAAMAKTVLGIVLILIAVRQAPGTDSLLVGWAGMVGLVFLLHLGLFDLLALAWRRAGIDVRPVMNTPLASRSLADFWSKRWNTAFNDFAHELVFRPLARRFGVTGASFGAFLASGLIHEMVISLPAGGGWGLPTVYFLAQGMGVAAERSRWGRRLKLGRGFRGWLFAMIITTAPAFWLFHPPFVHNVILPMLRAFGGK